MKQCVIPDAALRDKDSVEMIRVWIAEQGLHCVMNVGIYQEQRQPEAFAWGIILTDVARHVANALQERYGIEAEASLRQIREGFLAELDSPTSEAKGSFAPTRQ